MSLPHLKYLNYKHGTERPQQPVEIMWCPLFVLTECILIRAGPKWSARQVFVCWIGIRFSILESGHSFFFFAKWQSTFCQHISNLLELRCCFCASVSQRLGGMLSEPVIMSTYVGLYLSFLNFILFIYIISDKKNGHCLRNSCGTICSSCNSMRWSLRPPW